MSKDPVEEFREREIARAGQALDDLPLFQSSRATKAASYHTMRENKRKSTTRREQVFAALREICLTHNDASISEICQALGWQSNRIVPRLHELRDAGRVEEAPQRKCSITQMTITPWRIKQ